MKKLGQKGGRKRALSLSPRRRSQIARHAAIVRWALARTKRETATHPPEAA